MGKREDYSGELIPDIRYEDFSSEALARLLKAYCKEVLVLDAYWQEQMEKRLGQKVAFECQMANWVRIGRHEMRWGMEAMNIRGNDVEAYLKACQVIGSFAQDVYSYDIDLRSKNHGILTIHECPALSSLEQRDPGRIHDLCHVLEMEAFKAYTAAVNPAIQVRALKLPPRESSDEPACKWEFIIEP